MAYQRDKQNKKAWILGNKAIFYRKTWIIELFGMWLPLENASSSIEKPGSLRESRFFDQKTWILELLGI